MAKGKAGRISRRAFLGSALVTAATFTIVPRRVLGGEGQVPPSETLNVAKIGCGGMGKADLGEVAKLGCNIAALCDVDDGQAADAFKSFPDAKRYRDWRKMFDEMAASIDAVVVSTPDHSHAVASMAAMKLGKHVYCQKPLTRTVLEARAMVDAAHKSKVATQMGNQGHGGPALPATAEYIRAGAIGTVREVHVWTDRPGKWWHQATALPTNTRSAPESLDWDVWLGPRAERQFSPDYEPFRWRGWWDFGTGALGDMACHNMDPAFFALGLTYPVSVKATCPKFADVGYPDWSVIEWQFPAEGDRPAVKLFWYDGGKMPERPAELEEGRDLGDNGILFVGDKGKMLGGGWAGSCRIIPEAKMREFPRPERTLPRSIGHYKEWVEASKGTVIDGKPVTCGSNFDYAGAMTETVLLGNVALRYADQTLEWDGAARKFANVPEANNLLHYEYRKGWML
jgi:predicted dehydrogenase